MSAIANNNKSKKPERARKPKRNRGVRSSETRLLLGGTIVPTQDPPIVAYQPWNSMTLAWIATPGDCNFGHLVSQMEDQLDPNKTGFSSSPRVQMKIHSVRVWNLTDKTVALTVYDYHDADDADQLCGLMDAGISGSPRVGYQLPLSHRNSVVRNDASTGKRKLFTTSAASSSQLMHYVRLEWRFDGPVKGPTVDLNFARKTANSVEYQNANFGKVVGKISELIALQPSLLERIVNGVASSAAEVAVVGGDFDDLTNAIKELKAFMPASQD